MFKTTGGISIDGLRATWPFATLTIYDQRLDLHVRIGFFGVLASLPHKNTFTFRPEQVKAIRPVRTFLGKGIRIDHYVKDYSETVVFFSTNKAWKKLKQAVTCAGFPVE